MKNLLITGASGFVGAHCLSELAGRGFGMHAVTSRERRGQGGGDPGNGVNGPAREGDERAGGTGARWYRADLHRAEEVRDLVAAVRPEYLLHLAWEVTPGAYWNSPENLRWVGSSLNLLQAFIEGGGRRALLVGSCAEYDWNYGYCREGVTPLNPSTLYGTCKHALQMAAGAAAREAGLSAAWGRLFFLYGPGEAAGKLVSAVAGRVLAGREAPCTGGAQLRDFIYVKDAASALAALLESGVTGPVNIASGRPVTVGEVAAAAAETAGNANLLRPGAVKTPGEEPPLLLADTRRLNDEVRWRPRYSLQEGLRETVEALKSGQGGPS